MSKIDEVRKAMTDAMKAGDKPKKDVLSLLLSALKAKFVDKGRSDLTEEGENAVVYKEIKEAQETLETTPADRSEIIEECKLRIEVYSAFAPERMGADEIRKTVQKVLCDLGIEKPAAKDKGLIMKTLMPLVKGKADGALVNRIVTEAFQ